MTKLRHIIAVFILISLFTGCNVKETQNNSQNIYSTAFSQSGLVEALTSKVSARSATNMPGTNSFEPGSWNYEMSYKNVLPHWSMVEAEIIRQIEQPDTEVKLNFYYEIRVLYVYWGNVKEDDTVLISQSTQSFPGVYIYEHGQKIIFELLNEFEAKLLSDNGEISAAYKQTSLPLYVEEYNSTEYVLDYFKSDLAYEMYDRGLIKEKDDAFIVKIGSPYVTIVKKDLLASFFVLRTEYQTGKWVKTYSWAMEEGVEKESAQSEEEQKIQIIQ